MQGSIRVAVCAVVTAIATTASGVPAGAAVIIDSLMIRVYDTAGVLAGERARAMRDASNVLAAARVYVEWRDCTPPAGVSPPAECEAVPAAHDLLLRIGRAPERSGGGNSTRSLGYALIDTDAGRGSLATVYLDRVEWLAGKAHVPVTGLLGRAIAHELGHLVLGSNEHSDGGLMRAVWTAAEVARNRPADWAFSSRHRAVLLSAWLNAGGKPAS